jgi:hypothetical protein
LVKAVDEPWMKAKGGGSPESGRHFPMQKDEKISPSKSLLPNAPVMAPR